MEMELDIINELAANKFDRIGVPHLPPEVLYVIGTFMDVATIQATRLASRFMADTFVPFVVEKVWISSAEEDQKKLREISKHINARNLVREIVYDSTVYCGSLVKLSEYMKALGTSSTLGDFTYFYGRFGDTSEVEYTQAAVKRGHTIFRSFWSEQKDLILKYQCQHFTQTDMEMVDLPSIGGRGTMVERLSSTDRTGLSEVIQDMSVIPSLLQYFAPDLRCLLETLPLMPNVRRFSVTDQRWVKDQRRRWTHLPDEVSAFPKDRSFMIQRESGTGNRRGYDAVLIDPRPWPCSGDLPSQDEPTWYRGFWIMTQVASMLKLEQLKSFSVDADGYATGSGISHVIFNEIEPVRLQHTLNAFKYLTTLKLEIHTHDTDPWTDFAETLATGNIAKMLCASEQLQSLDLTFDDSETLIADLSELFGKDHIWPDLTELTLTNMCLNGDQWVDFLIRQRGSLRKLSIIMMSFWAPNKPWMLMFAAFELMALETFYIVYLKEQDDPTDEDPEVLTGSISGFDTIKIQARALLTDEMQP